MRSLLVVLAAAALLAMPATASAGIWTPVASNTTQDITAVDYRAADQLFYATANGQILRNGVQQLSVPGVSFTGIELNPSGTAGLATANNGKLYRYNGTAWSLVSLANTTRNHLCPGSGGPFAQTSTPTGNLTGVSWKDDTTAYISGVDRGVVLKSTNAGVNWSDVSRQSDGTCFADPGFGATLSDVATVKATDLVYVVTDSFGGRRFSADGFAGPTAVRNNTSVNCFDVPMKIAVDQDNPNRNFMVGKCAGSLAFGFSSDGGVTYDISLEYANGNGNNITSLYDVALAGGNAIAVGDGGVILTSPDGLKAYFQPADGSEATTGWRAVDKFDANNAAVVGVGGKLVISTQAGTIPDLIAPAGTISGPVSSNRRPARDIHRERHRQRRRFGHRPGGLPVERDRRADGERQPGGDHVPERRLLHAEGDVQGPRRQRRRGDLVGQRPGRATLLRRLDRDANGDGPRWLDHARGPAGLRSRRRLVHGHALLQEVPQEGNEEGQGDEGRVLHRQEAREDRHEGPVPSDAHGAQPRGGFQAHAEGAGHDQGQEGQVAEEVGQHDVLGVRLSRPR